MAKKMPKKGKGGRGCIAVLAIMAAWVLSCACYDVAHAEDAPVFSARRLSIAAQAGLEWERPTNVDQSTERIPSVRLVPVWRLWGPVKDGVEHEGGSFAIVAPLSIGLDSNHPFRGGVFVSCILWSGADQP